MSGPAEPRLRSLYSPSLGQVGCVLLNAAFGIADRRVNRIFSARDWFVSPVDDMFVIEAPLSEWEQVAAMERTARPGPEHFAAMRMAPANTGGSDV